MGTTPFIINRHITHCHSVSPCFLIGIHHASILFLFSWYYSASPKLLLFSFILYTVTLFLTSFFLSCYLFWVTFCPQFSCSLSLTNTVILTPVIFWWDFWLSFSCNFFLLIMVTFSWWFNFSDLTFFLLKPHKNTHEWKMFFFFCTKMSYLSNQLFIYLIIHFLFSEFQKCSFLLVTLYHVIIILANEAANQINSSLIPRAVTPHASSCACFCRKFHLELPGILMALVARQPAISGLTSIRVLAKHRLQAGATKIPQHMML